ncbi:hypothetical protein [Legionella cardiaca]|uniref:Phosphonate metabolism protein n=1 Tax=Legionella cardiaca TaxID=1071983 RepID=A0ABY8ARG8_9GAMM|nr:hypothetical protein [Legionella cardiaca]WED43123.1 hypothetical protein PXX05_14680 [Legionella cardiaca]
MGNRITHNRKKILHCILLNLCLGLLFLEVINAFAGQTSSVSVNVYLKFPANNAIKDLIKEFNSSLSKKNILSDYHLTPFLQQHPLHITLYLTHYNQSQIEQIINRTQMLAKQTSPILVKTTIIETSPSMYTMLFVINNEHLQRLSNQFVIELMSLRDKQAKIPSWAEHDKNKCALFKRFGSPTVFKNFSPHFSILAAEHLTQREAIELQSILRPIIDKFNKHHPGGIQAKAMAIGIGLADSQGQIIKELQSFSLK